MNKKFPKETNKKLFNVYLQWIVLLIAFLMLVFFRGNKIVAAYYLNIGMKALIADNTQDVVLNMKAALRYQPDNVVTYRCLAQAYLDMNQPEQAFNSAQQAILLSPDDASIQLLLGDAYDQLGNSEQAITYYESSATENRQIQLAVNYLQLADQLWSEGKRKEALTIWRDKARDNEYSSLYANWRLAQYYADDEEAATPYREAARYFPLESVAPPPDLRLAAYQTQSILGVVADGLWTRDTLLNVVSYRVWQDQSVSTEDILQNILVNNPDDTDIHFYLGELYHRRSDWEKAESEYRQVLSIDPQYAQAYLRLGMVFESKNSQARALNEAVNWYKQYHQLAPDDILGLKRLVEVCTVLEQTGDAGVNCQNTVALQEEQEVKTDDRRIVAEMLNVSLDEVTLGPNLVENGGFEKWEAGQPNWWAFSAMFSKEPFSDAVFIGDSDDLLSVEGRQVARVDGLWIHQQKGLSAPRGGFWNTDKTNKEQKSVPLAANTPYALSFQYRTSRIPDGKATVWVSSAQEPDLFWAGGDYGVPATNGIWTRFVAIGWNRSDTKAAIRPLLRLFTPGSVEFDDVQVRLIALPDGINIPRETQFMVIGKNKD